MSLGGVLYPDELILSQAISRVSKKGEFLSHDHVAGALK